VSEVQDLDGVRLLNDPVIDEKWTVDQFAHAATLRDWHAHARESDKQIDVIEKRTAKAERGLCVVVGDAADDFVKIV